ncbi:hypothetical protein GALMADRAFT_253388 [Galerina marginata CBS 339.88]|uniref:Uncharacterized protein n=1 Tax=Galerina marginata (strain CBS 339.88) TaxID=685588 RepID=A0A067SLA2_GALM3|nr:hypothetical protein GALMADRAFT_253388 [Galerina marginata CBS 339.88]
MRLSISRLSSEGGVGLEDELGKGLLHFADGPRFDYEPFIREYLQRAHQEGLLNALLDRDDDGRKRRGGSLRRRRRRRGRRDERRWASRV